MCSSDLKRVIETFEGPLDLRHFKDEYRAGLQQIIDAKIAGEAIAEPAVEPAPKVVKLMEALRKSLDSVSTTRKQPAKVAVKRAGASRRKKAS